jgi:hypothetical protein
MMTVAGFISVSVQFGLEMKSRTKIYARHLALALLGGINGGSPVFPYCKERKIE